MSAHPLYIRMVRGSNLDVDNFKRANSTVPESFYLRHHESKGRPGISRGLSCIRQGEFKPRPLPPNEFRIKNFAVSNSGYHLSTSENYWVDRFINNIPYPGTGVYVSNAGQQYQVYPNRKMYPANYWAYYPYPSSRPFYAGGSLSTNRSRPLNGITTNWSTNKVWDWLYPDKFSARYYRPGYLHSLRARRYYENIVVLGMG